MHTVEQYRKTFVAYLESQLGPTEPKNLYDPIRYILGLGGKRIRPVLVLMATEVFGCDFKKALDAALAIEIFHNFSLVHDDIMDNAPLRRGNATVHEKWNVNTAILSGDAMLIQAYRLFENYDGDTFRELAKIFGKTALEVCEGQQYDVDFETRDDVTIAEYLKMIEYKTAVLLAAALKMGGIVAGASLADQEAIYGYGKYLGLAFQLQDDYLDAFGDPETFGKQVGGDIIANKKTYLYLKALTKGNAAQRDELKALFAMQPNNPTPKITQAKTLFEATGAAGLTLKEIGDYTQKAFDLLQKLNIDEESKARLQKFGEGLMVRNV